MRFIGSYAVLLCLFANQLTSQEKLQIRAERALQPIQIDGVLSESIWQRPGLTDFKMKRPVEGIAPSQRTEVWVAFDDAAIYVAARMHDTAPDSIMRVLGRRDFDVTADWFCFYADPYHDKHTGYYFAVSAVGSLQDGTLYNDDWNDDSWDGVWEAKTSIDSQGWSAELRIPYSQLRFIEMPSYVWGVNFRRSIGRTSERDQVVYTPNKESGFVSRFIELNGIENITPPRQAELLPYFTSRAEYLQHSPNDPFNNGSRYLPGIGADLKVALTSNLTLNGTLNPDFGQVEVDPAVVNLSDVESYFQEKRPFFVEGSNTFSFGQGGSNSNWGFNWGNPTFFYTRRIGRSPQGSLPGYDYADVPLGTHILGAGKVTGKIGDNWNFGTVHALTSREFAKIQLAGARSEVEVEPMAYYGIARLQKDFNDGRQGFGVIATNTTRVFDDNHLRDEINSNAITGGVDGWTFLDDDKVYVVNGWVGFSRIEGNSARMIALQRNSRHYFQRPDANYLSVDSNATSMNGFGGRIALNKQKGQWMLNMAIGALDPGLDVNDMGFQWRNDVINYHIAGGYKWTDPTPYYNSARVQGALFESRDFGNRAIWHGIWTNGRIEFPNFWSSFVGFTYNPSSLDTRATRGGPAQLNPLGREFFGGVSSDSRKPVMAELNWFSYFGGGGEQYNLNLSLEIKPAPNVNIGFGPGWSRNMSSAQWVTSYADPTAVAMYGNRYVYADFDQTTISADVRLNWTFSPQLSLQLFMQPLVSSGKYTNFKHFLTPGTFDFETYGKGTSTVAFLPGQNGNSDSYDVDADGAGASPTVNIGKPDFNFTSLRGNAVLRWEYRPGSAIYFVWTQSRADNINDGEFQLKPSFDRMFTAKPDNIFMVKFTYWFNM
jgi:hypothetical protein